MRLLATLVAWLRALDLRYRLSRLVPVLMRSTYSLGVGPLTAKPGEQLPAMPVQRASWVQWRDRIWRHRIVSLTP